MALGGKREKGARNEKNDRMPVLGTDEVAILCDGCADLRERKVNKTEVRKNATAMIIRGNRMMMMLRLWSAVHRRTRSARSCTGSVLIAHPTLVVE